MRYEKRHQRGKKKLAIIRRGMPRPGYSGSFRRLPPSRQRRPPFCQTPPPPPSRPSGPREERKQSPFVLPSPPDRHSAGARDPPPPRPPVFSARRGQCPGGGCARRKTRLSRNFYVPGIRTCRPRPATKATPPPRGTLCGGGNRPPFTSGQLQKPRPGLTGSPASENRRPPPAGDPTRGR